MPILFPDICRSILAKKLHESIELSYIELQKAFAAFANCVPAGLKVFFVIDGIDEYEGDCQMGKTDSIADSRWVQQAKYMTCGGRVSRTP